jgi:hypothetical protein
MRGFVQSYEHIVSLLSVVRIRIVLTFVIIARGSLKEKAFPFGDIQCTVGIPASSLTFFCTFRKLSKDGTCLTPISHSNHKIAFIIFPDMRRRGRLSSVSNRNSSFDLYGNQDSEAVKSGSSSTSSSSRSKAMRKGINYFPTNFSIAASV